MLILSRKLNETIVIDDGITVTVVGIRGKQIKIGIDAPGEVQVHRQEVVDAMTADRDKSNPLIEKCDMNDRSLLVVSNDPQTRSVLTTMLACEGADVDTASTSACALEYACKKKYDVAIIDESLEKMHGQELFERINRSQTGLKGILCSERPTVATVDAAIDSGMEHVVQKPIDQAELLHLTET